MGGIIDNIGLPYSGLNLSYSNSAPIGAGTPTSWWRSADDHGRPPTTSTICGCALASEFPGVQFSFIPADIVSQILNFGLPAPIDVQVVGRNLDANRAVRARRCCRSWRACRAWSTCACTRWRTSRRCSSTSIARRAAQVGLTQRDVANNLLVSLSGSGQTSPTFWLNPATGVSYAVATQTPQYRMDSLQDLGSIPITGGGSASTAAARRVSPTVHREAGMAVVSHYNVQPVMDIYGSVQGRDLGGVAREIAPIIDAARKDLPRGSQLVVRGQIETMTASFTGLLAGLALAIVLVYLLIVVNFQSWLDPFIIISALPAALAGIVWMLFVTGTTISVPALTGAIMCMGVATANSILVVSFAKDELAPRPSAVEAARRRRLRAVPPGADDRAGDDHRHGADGAGAGRGRRAERAARPRRDRRPRRSRRWRRCSSCRRCLRCPRWSRPRACGSGGMALSRYAGPRPSTCRIGRSSVTGPSPTPRSHLDYVPGW